jgi:hypothetical protein
MMDNGMGKYLKRGPIIEVLEMVNENAFCPSKSDGALQCYLEPKQSKG